MASSDLATLPDARLWCGGTGNITADDDLLKRLISSASRIILSYLARDTIALRSVAERYDGQDRERLLLRGWPVLSVTSLSIDGVAIAAANLANNSPSGHALESWNGAPPGSRQRVDLFGGNTFCRGRQNVAIIYVAGYGVIGEAATIPTDGKVTVAAPHGPWASDFAVTFANGTPLSAVASSATPSAGHYAIAADTPGQYQFATADASQGVLISYGYTPHDLYQACVELVGERYKYKDRIGTASKTLGGQETVSFSLKDLSDAIRLMLNPYRNVVPV
jgi:hypothetical protein